MKLSKAIAIGVLCGGALAAVAIKTAIAPDDQQALLETDRAALGSGTSSIAQNSDLLDPNFTWTDSSGSTRSKTELMQDIRSGKGLPLEAGNGGGGGKIILGAIGARAYGQVGVVQTSSGTLYTLHVWIKRSGSWRLLVYQAVSIGTPPSADLGTGECENPCKTVPFQPQSEDEREVIGAYQSVERAVTAHDSAAWGSHIAEEFFAVTSNSDRPLDKAARMAGLDRQKVGGIPPFPLRVRAHVCIRRCDGDDFTAAAGARLAFARHASMV